MPNQVALSSSPVVAHYPAFQLLVSGQADQVRALIEFGLYVESECRWLELLSTKPTSKQIADWHFAAAQPSRIESVKAEAARLLKEFGDQCIQEQQKIAIHSAIEAIRSAPRSKCQGVWEATQGAALYTALLIFFAFVLHWSGVDLVEVFKRVAGSG